MPFVLARYTSVGVMNTLMHWVASTVFYVEGQSQSLSNYTAFCLAVTFSFFANAWWTFSTEANAMYYLLYLFFMGGLISAIGMNSDRHEKNLEITLFVFLLMSLSCGFIHHGFFINRGRWSA
ncbi:GtrA family protein [Pantoea anthophila]|uniref:GtrA family protein n=1 Tax=Pantoea anthophila TaxID=470931 RepID=UPI002DB660D7|nr:GtrA family protein [Pantoea anthophila]MEB7537320.1 GtrA family protein [Pantoea anthophila]